jgi:cellulose synthase/poly-beta-1,6-N-acetylglucosamine synthase-like glycosyltransferase
MHQISSIILYSLAFLSTYVQVVFLLTFLQKRKEIQIRNGHMELETYPEVTIIVPAWNEQHTLRGTVESLFALDYPADKLNIFLVDDGSTDGTWEVMKSYEGKRGIKVLQKENGGKHTAVNYGIANSTSRFIGCLDADSFVHPQALKRIMSYFERDPETMAVSPSIIVNKPKGIMQIVQRVEYEWAVFNKKMLGFLGGIYVTPGPFSFYRREVFEKIGNYVKAHNTEDMEIAFRMQSNRMKIDQCNDAFVYTTAPNSVRKLYKQRLRWIYGFIMNCWDYRSILFKRKYGTFSVFSVPAGVISMLAVPYILSLLVYNTAVAATKNIERLSMTGFDFSITGWNVDPFFFATGGHLFVMIMMYSLLIISISIGRKMATGKGGVDYYLVPFMLIFSVIAPFWILRAMYNSMISRKAVSWR